MMLHLDYAKQMEESGLIEELFMHEGAHVSLDGHHQKVEKMNYWSSKNSNSILDKIIKHKFQLTIFCHILETRLYLCTKSR